MKTILIVRRPFKSMGQYYPLGSIIKDLSRVKTLRMKINEGKVVELYEGHPSFNTIIGYIEHRAKRSIRGEVLKELRDVPITENTSEKSATKVSTVSIKSEPKVVTKSEPKAVIKEAANKTVQPPKQAIKK